MFFNKTGASTIEIKENVDITKGPPQMINGIQFSLMTGPDMKQVSEVTVVNSSLYQHSTMNPIANGLLDAKMGTSTQKVDCSTCGNALTDCAGHWGHYELYFPAFHIGFVPHILSVLRMVCKYCSRILLSPDERKAFTRGLMAKRDYTQRLRMNKQIEEACRKNQICAWCGERNGDVKKIGPMRFVHLKWGKTKKGYPEKDAFISQFGEACKPNKDLKPLLEKGTTGDDLNPLFCRTLFEKIPTEDLLFLDMKSDTGRPEDMIFTQIPVPPCCIRPSVAAGDQTNQDDLTIVIKKIIVTDQGIRRLVHNSAPISKLMELWDYVQIHLAIMINSGFPGCPPEAKEGKPIRGICQRLKGKTGRFRGNLSGKRVDFTSRTVISPDPNLGINQVGVPRDVAMTLTFPERVTKINLQKMKQLVRNGQDIYPGAKAILNSAGEAIRSLRYGDREKFANELQIGHIIERHLIDGDVVLFNRQPSLHRISIMAHIAKVLPWKTFRFNECCCAPYNADFDGDEMNIHFPQTWEARAEALTLMASIRNLATPKNGALLIAATQDFLTASFLLTKRNTFYDKATFTQMCSHFSANGAIKFELPSPAILKPVQLFTGKQVISMLIKHSRLDSSMVNLEKKTKNYNKGKDQGVFDESEGCVVIRNGELLCGTLCKETLGGGKNNLFQLLLRDYSDEVAADKMGKLARLCARWIGDHGFSIGIDDVTPGPNLKRRKDELIRAGYEECQQKIDQFKQGGLVPDPGCSLDQTLESQMQKILSNLREKMGEVCMEELPSNNSPLIMTQCGSKGSKVNISQMVSSVGQQTLSGNRIPNGFHQRTLPHFKKEDAKSPAAKGFVSNSFYSGLLPFEFFFHTMGGREGLIDTAVKTAETGYMQRRLMKALEDLCIQYDGTVRNSTNQVIQFIYGDDGIEPTYIEEDSVPLNYQRLLTNLLNRNFKPQMPVTLDTILTLFGQEEKRNKELREIPKAHKDSLLNFLTAGLSEEQKISILKRERLGEYANEASGDDLGMEVENQHNNNHAANNNSVAKRESNGVAKKQQQLAKNQQQRNTYPHAAVLDPRLDEKVLLEFLRLIATKMRRAIAEPGTAIGALCAQSIGEPCTQMTLKTFHFAGVASMNITQGVPRIRELMDATKNISTPFITAKLTNKHSEIFARRAKGHIERLYLGDVMEYMQEVYMRDGTVKLEIKIDWDLIDDLRVDVTFDTIVESILADKSQGLKLKKGNIDIADYNSDVIAISPRVAEAFFAIQKIKAKIGKIIICGLPSVSRCVIATEKGGGKGDRPAYELLIEGTGLASVFRVPGIDWANTFCNHPLETAEVLGIEAGRKVIIDEISHTMTEHSVSVDPRHLKLLADIMTYKGEILGITRNGIAKMKDSILMLASFEKTTDFLFNAGVYSINEEITGVSECIIMGKTVPVGTGLFSLLHATPPIQSHKKRTILGSKMDFSLRDLI